ncbi:MAG: ADP-forming succinate--CoA ligase subunit beta [bacterium]|nr:ADP-forming succinate--CoA ligase subunit beta [bacterium]
MKLYEYLAKRAFAEAGIPVPPGRVVSSPAEAAVVCREIGPVAIKSQVLAGGRGKAGGIAFADWPHEAEARAAEILGKEIRGYRVEELLVEKKLTVQAELYFGVAVEGAARRPVVIASTQGGVNIEEVPEKAIVRRAVDPIWGFRPYRAREVVRRLGLTGNEAGRLADILHRLWQVFRRYDAELVEINPLVLTSDGPVAADGRLNVDDYALFRHKDLPAVEEGSDRERKARSLGLAYVELGGDIAVMANGAGITMGTLDVLQELGGRPANFLDAGGGAGVEPMTRAIEMLLDQSPKVVLVNIFGGITRCDDVAQAVVAARASCGTEVPFVIRLVGTNEGEGLAILREHGLDAYTGMEEAAARAVALARGR